MKKLLLNIFWYIKKGYVKKFFLYIKCNGLKGLKKKLKRALKNNVYDIPVCAFVNDNIRKILCGNVPKLEKSKSVKRHTENVDIIICVHNAYEDVKRCMESVLKHSLEPFRIIIIDDGSGEQTKIYLETLAKECLNVKLIRNEQGCGYTIAANKGLKYSDAQYCVLLNSDTIVTENWLDKMINCQKSGNNIGVVGPLSNTASWQSVPEISDENGDWAKNKLPDNISLENYSKLIDSSSGQVYPKVPLLNGFCMMLHRSVIEKIGYFDEENFGSGYSEEDDYNIRANNAGFELAIADDTYIYHAQSKSYSDEKRMELCNSNGRKLREKHGDELLDKYVYIMKDNLLLEGIRARVRIMTEREQLINNAKEKWEGKRILFLLPIENAGGGGNVVIQEAYSMMKMGIKISLYNLNRYKDSFNKGYPDIGIPVLYGEKLESFREFAGDFDIICATMYTTVKHCNFENLDIKTRSAYYIQDFEPYFYETDDVEYKEAIDSYNSVKDNILVTKTDWNSATVEKTTGKKAIIIGKSVDIDNYRPRKLFPNKEKIVISAMIRPDSERRAPELTLKILNKTAEKYNEKVSIIVFGSDPDNAYADRDFWNNNKINPQIVNLGKLDKFEMASVLSCTDIFADFSSFQAMGLTSMEAMACGCGVIVPKNGGSVEFVTDGKNGIVVDTTDKDACMKALYRLIEDHEYLYKLGLNALNDICEYIPEKCAYNFLNACFG